MKHRKLGISPIQVPPIIFGAWAIGGWLWGGEHDQDALEAIRASIDNGITAIDTAPVYGFGHSEVLVGKAIKGIRDKVVIATKCGLRWDTKEGSDPWVQKDLHGNDVTIMANSRPAGIIEECEKSLQRLGVDFIDLYQIHWPDISTPLEDSWSAMIKLKDQGKVRAIGVSNYTVDQLSTIHRLSPVASDQPPYSIARRNIENDIIPFCTSSNIGLIVYSPMERGLLTGKITENTVFPQTDHRANSSTFSMNMRKKTIECIAKLKSLQDKYNATPAQLIIHWTCHQPGITSAIVGARNKKQAEENAKALSFRLTQEEISFMRSCFDALAEEMNKQQASE
jgi:methylglyoxal reductase